MSEELLKSRHAFGSEANVDAAIDQGLVDAYDILFLKEGKIGWIDGEGKKVILEDKQQIVRVEELPVQNGDMGVVYVYNDDAYIWSDVEHKCVPLCEPTDLTNLQAEVEKKANADVVDEKFEQVEQAVEQVEQAFDGYLAKKYEITNVPSGTLVDYRDKEIRVMCPANAVFVKQNVGATGSANMYYMAFKAYAPEGAVSFKEGDRGVIIDEMYTFVGDFAGTDALGRNYSICWLALASYNESANEWTYYGKNSSVDKYIGWDYVVEWYDANGVVMSYDHIRINLSNEDCHSLIEPYYVSDTIEKAVDAAKKYADEKINDAVAVIEF